MVRCVKNYTLTVWFKVDNEVQHCFSQIDTNNIISYETTIIVQFTMVKILELKLFSVYVFENEKNV